MLGLYFNSFLTGEPAWSPRPTAYPLYPRSGNWDDSYKKIEVCKASIRSMAPLPIGKIILNIHGSEQFEKEVQEIKHFTQHVFPSAEILYRNSRPSTVVEWQTDLTVAEKFFGKYTPVICAYNHDHIFVDYSPKPFINLIESIFTKDKSEPHFLYYSHFPEMFSIANNPQATREAFLSLSPTGEWFGDLSTGPLNSLITHAPGVIHSYFVTNSIGLGYIWENAVCSSNYIPRPDWSSVKFPNTIFKCILPRREFFRHFDGYGHVSITSNGMSLDLSNCHTTVSPASIYSNTQIDNQKIHNIIDFYYKKYFEVTTIAIRNSMYFAMRSGSLWFGRSEIESALTTFLNAYITVDAEIFDWPSEIVYKIRQGLTNRVLSSSSRQLNEAWGDILFNRTDLFRKPEESLLTRLIRRINRFRN